MERLKVYTIIILGIIFFNGHVFAQSYTCNDDQTILRLFSQTNSHGAVWNNNAGYTFEICYNELFGVEYNPVQSGYSGENHECNNNLVLTLSGTTNAHASGPAGPPYNNQLCFGDLFCQIENHINPTDNCNNGIKVVGLSTPNNAHLEVASQTNYNNFLCCTQGVNPNGDFTNLKWQNTGGQEINETFVNNTLTMIAQTILPTGTTVTFQVWESDPESDNIPNADSDDDFVFSINASVQNNGMVSANWPITHADMNIAGTGEIDPWEYYFRISSTNTNPSYSPFLYVHNFKSPDSGPKAKISSPIHRQIYFPTTLILDASSSFDPDSQALTYTWTITDNNLVQNTITTQNSTTNFDFTNKNGTILITLKVTDTTGKSDEKQIGILLLDSGLLTYINKPFHKEFIPAQSGALLLTYNANDSYIITSNAQNDCSGTITCLAGICPSQTQNAPQGCSNYPVQNPNQNFNLMNFLWTFSDGTSTTQGVSGQKLLGQDDGEKSGQQTVTLTTSYQTQSETTTRTFSIGQCVNNGATFIEVNSENEKLAEHSTINTAWCVGSDGISGSADDCCPGAQQCSENGCILPETTTSFCSQETEQSICQNSTAWQNDPLKILSPACGTIYQGTIVICSCQWKNESCLFKKDFQSEGTFIQTPQQSQWTCEYQYEEGTCNAGFMSIPLTAIFTNGDNKEITAEEAECVSSTQQAPCGQYNFDLPIFSNFNLLITIIIVINIYFILSILKKNKR